MPWACKLQGKALRLEDLEIGVLEDFAKTHETEWVSVVFTPLQNLSTAKDLIALCAGQLGVEAPTEWTAKVLIDAFELVDDDLPETFEADGTPTEGAGLPTESSSDGASPLQP